MYKRLEKTLLTLSVLLVISFAMFIVMTQHKKMFAGTDGAVYVLRAKADFQDIISRIAKEKKVLIAKQIMVPMIDGKLDNQPTFQKFGMGKLPADFPEQKDKAFLDMSGDITNFFIFGKGLASDALSNELNRLGNTTIVSDNDWRFQGITAMLDLRMIIGTGMFVLSYMSLLMAQAIINLKKQGVQRLAGISCLRLAFSGIRQRMTYLLINTTVGLLISVVILYMFKLKRLMYVSVILFPALFWLLVLLAVDCIIGLVIYLLLRRQKINLVIKDRAPITALMYLVLGLQLIALMSLMVSFSYGLSLSKEVRLLNKAQKAWSTSDYYAPSLMNENPAAYRDQFFDFLAAAAEREEVMLVGDNFNHIPIDNQYFPTPEGNENIIYVTPNYLDKVGVKLESSRTAIEVLGNRDTAILVPASQKSQKEALVSIWSKRGFLGNTDEIKKSDIGSDIYRMTGPDMFTFRIFGWSAPDNQAFVRDPLIMVLSPRIFKNKNYSIDTFMAWISRCQILFSDRDLTASLIKKYGLQSILGSFSNGKFSVATRLADTKSQQLFIGLASLMALVSASFLFYLMNNIYLYQNRKKFTILRLSGYTMLDIHKTYLTQVLIILIFAMVMSIIFGLNTLALIVPFLFGGLLSLIFRRQLKNEQAISLAVLKGE